MARYTIELKDVVKAHNIFDFKYPFYDEKKRHEFERKFIRHFYFREIGCETIDRFIFYLEDKLNTVLPYYNKLFEAAEIEYSILNNYNLTEKFTTTRKNEGKTAGVSSTVGQFFGNQETQTDGNRVTDTEGTADTVSRDTEKETVHTVTHDEGNSVTLNEQNVEGSANKTTSETEDVTHTWQKRFLDTPQGLFDLDDTRYMTNLEQMGETNEKERDVTEQSTDSQDTNGTSETNTENDGTVDTTRDVERNGTVQQDTTGKETTVDTVKGTVSDEQKSTSDNNTRTYSEGQQTETHELTRVGNIGVDTDSDMIEKHIRLQKTLTQIELMFFNECEDLFMMVY